MYCKYTGALWHENADEKCILLLQWVELYMEHHILMKTPPLLGLLLPLGALIQLARNTKNNDKSKN